MIFSKNYSCEWIKKYTLSITIIVLTILIVIFHKFFVRHEQLVLSGTLGILGSIFSALKYKLDRANYHKDLFSKRFEIYSICNHALWHWATNKYKIDENIYKEISSDFLAKAYFLFEKSTYKFIVQLRTDLLLFHKGDSLDYSPEKETAKQRLVDLIDNQIIFMDKFKNMDIKFY